MSLVTRKMKTLINNPKGVYNKYVSGKKEESNGKENSIEVKDTTRLITSTKKLVSVKSHVNVGSLISPRVSFVLHDVNNNIEVNHIAKKLRNLSFTSLLFLENKKYVSNCQIADGINKAINYISFREHNLFFADVVLNRDYNIANVFNSSVWRSNPFKTIKNAIFVNPSLNYVNAVAFSNPSIKTIAVFDGDVQFSNLDIFDMVVVSKNYLDTNHRNVKFFDCIDDIPKIVGEYINLTSERPFDLLVPAFGKFDYIDDIDQLNNSGVHAIFWLDKKPKVDMCTFDVLCERVSKNTRAVLVKESILYKYKTLIDNNNIQELFKSAASDGLKVEVKYDLTFK